MKRGGEGDLLLDHPPANYLFRASSLSPFSRQTYLRLHFSSEIARLDFLLALNPRLAGRFRVRVVIGFVRLFKTFFGRHSYERVSKMAFVRL